MTFDLLVCPGVEELDFAGPWDMLRVEAQSGGWP
jgi:hypothetical protein